MGLTVRMPTWQITVDGKTFRQGGDRTFETVREYVESGHWQIVRNAWCQCYGDDAARCFFCRKEPAEFHHLSYDDLGLDADWRVLDQIIPLCTWHHYEIEKKIRGGIWPRATAHLWFIATRIFPDATEEV
jgi:hypothetical protein